MKRYDIWYDDETWNKTRWELRNKLYEIWGEMMKRYGQKIEGDACIEGTLNAYEDAVGNLRGRNKPIESKVRIPKH